MFADFRGQKNRASGSDRTQVLPSRPKRRFGQRSRFSNRNQHQRRQRRQYQTGVSSEKLGDSANLRIIPLGGCEEVGRNMTVFEYDGDIIILDMGLQFPEEDMPGIDYIIPNTKYLAGKEKKIRGVIFSHGHLDHIGAAPILLEKLGNPPIVARDLTLALLKNKQEDYKRNSAKNLKTITVKNLHDTLRLGKFTIKFFQIEHSIMDAMGVIIETPVGTVIHPGDWTLERDDNGRPTIDYHHLSGLPRPTVLMLECLGVLNISPAANYKTMYKNLLGIMQKAEGRVIIGTFSSQVERIKWVIDAADQLGKKVALDGYSMKLNIEIAKELGYIKIRKGVLIDIKDIDGYPHKQVVVICTGAQGEENAVLARIISRQHRFVELRKSDTVIFSSSIIPGNERTIQRLKDNIYRQADHVIHGEIMDVHVSGHATRADVAEMLEQIQPTYFVPVYANHYFLKEARNLAIERGFAKENIFVPDNGSVIEINQKSARISDKKVQSDYVFVDGLGVSDTQNIVLRDRQVLAEDGMVVVIATVDSKTGKLVQNPDIISRGFIFLKENRELIEDIRHRVKKMVIQSDPLSWADTNQIRNDIRDKIGQFLFSKTEKRPMVLPVVIEV
ncbi:MAG: ribonuclease J [Candidatus Magasanikbacteria bacterium]|nr:ribonuclease J [Candidatus Magasanikbacteria bacterium]